MARYIVRRLAGMVLLLILVSAVTFVIFNVFPSTDPAALRAGRQPTPELIERDPRRTSGSTGRRSCSSATTSSDVFAHLDFGRSYVRPTPTCSTRSSSNLPATISLAIGGVVVWLTFGLSVGIISAVRHRSVFDRVAIGLSLVAISAPVYWLGLVALYLFAPDFGVFGLAVRRRAGLLRAVLRGPGAVVPVADPAVVRARDLVRGDLRAAAARLAARRARRGLHPHGAGQGPGRAPRDPAPRRAQRDHAGRHRARPRHRHPARRRDPHRVRLQHPGHRPARLRRDHRAATCRSSRAPCSSARSSSSS